MQRIVCGLAALLFALMVAGNAAGQDTCGVGGDINGDGVALTIADLIHLIRFANSNGPPPNPLHEGDLNANGDIDYGDLARFDSVFTSKLDRLQAIRVQYQ